MEPSSVPARHLPPHHLMHEHHKNVKRGTDRLDRRSGAGVKGQPKKSGHGGKFTWDGPLNEEDYSEDTVVALDENDPNFVEELNEDEARTNLTGGTEAPGVVMPPKASTAVSNT